MVAENCIIKASERDRKLIGIGINNQIGIVALFFFCEVKGMEINQNGEDPNTQAVYTVVDYRKLSSIFIITKKANEFYFPSFKKWFSELFNLI